jgi:hypothetical protein
MRKHIISTLHPVHVSVVKRGRISPNRMARISMPDEMRETMTRVAIDIFTDMSNANHSFQDALLAIYLSGLQHAHAITSEGKAA